MIFTIATGLYVLVLIYVSIGMVLNRAKPGKRIVPISIIIAARNEESRIHYLLEALGKLDYPEDSYEVLIVNDHSTDGTAAILAGYDGKHNIRVLHNDIVRDDLIGKKAAIQFGILHAKYDVFAFTDADCVPHPRWLRAISNGLDEQTDYMLGYTFVLNGEKGRIFSLKNFERSIYCVLAAAGMYYRRPITSSASNMVYRRKCFIDCGGFEGIGHIRSGDDDLLLLKMMPYIRKARFNTSVGMMMLAIENGDVKTRYHANIRKASKWQLFPHWLKLTAFFVLVYFVWWYFQAARFALGEQQLMLPLIVKSATEITMMSLILLRLKKLELLLWYPVMLVWYPMNFVYFGLRGYLGRYHWK